VRLQQVGATGCALQSIVTDLRLALTQLLPTGLLLARAQTLNRQPNRVHKLPRPLLYTSAATMRTGTQGTAGD
jgi:hypothetical protein